MQSSGISLSLSSFGLYQLLFPHARQISVRINPILEKRIIEIQAPRGSMAVLEK